ncbi:S-layer homology domain-containing protein [Paenibacillus frigoriresistens]|nr:S-layer homology domain-containing protein [Paenibacillus frigoriresistens]
MGVMTFQINVKDNAGTYSQTIEATSDGSSVTVKPAPVAISGVHIASSNGDHSAAVTGDTVTLTFTTTEQVSKLGNFKIKGSNPATFTSVESGSVYTNTATYVLDGTDPMGVMTFQINVKDSAGTYSQTIEATSDGSSVTVKPAPVAISGVHIASNHAGDNSSAVTGDTVTLTFTTTEQVSKLGNFKINGSNPATFTSVESGSVYTNTATYVLDGTDRMGVMTFQIDVKDSAGTYSQTIEATSDGSLVTVRPAPVAISNVHIASNHAEDNSSAVTGDTVTLTFTTTEQVSKLSNFKINGGNPATFTSAGAGSAWTNTATYVIDATDPLGVMTFQINVKDAAGTYSQTNEATSDNSSVTVKASTTNALSSLSLSGITLDQTVSENTYTYTATVPNDISVTTVTYTTVDENATADLQINGSSVSNPVPLSVGSNVISVVVTAQDGTTKSYSVTVTRVGSSNAALSSLNLSGITLDQTVSENMYTYTATVPNSVSITTATYTTTDIHAIVALNLNGQPVNNPISLNVGSNIISFVVTAHDGTMETYTVSVTREPQLVTAITVSSASTTMYVGDSLHFSANVTPGNATDKTFSWAVVPGTGVATINADGLLVATQAGTITVQATAHDRSGVVGTEVITIYIRSSGQGSSPTPTDTNPTPAPVPTPDPTPNPATDVFKTDVVKGDTNVVKNIETRIQAAIKTPVIVTLSDTKGHWAEKTIDTFVKLHVIEGYNDGTFKPDGNITRAEFTVILSRVFDIQGGNNTSVALKDVGSHWAKDAIEKLAEAGVISGYEDGTFKPDNTINREEMVVMLSRILNLNNVSKDTTKGNFDDLNGSYAANEIKTEAQAGIISGEADGKFDAKSNSTRAEALQIILNALNLNPQLKTLLDSLN